jgi:hypothetical protein
MAHYDKFKYTQMSFPLIVIIIFSQKEKGNFIYIIKQLRVLAICAGIGLTECDKCWLGW